MCFWWLKTLFWSSRLKTHVFEKHLNLVSCISFMKLLGLSCFCIIFCSFSKKIKFPEFRSIECVFQLIENSLIFNHCSWVGSIGFRSIEYDLFIFQSIKVNFQPIESLKEILRSSLPCSIGTQSIEIRKERKIKRIPQHVFFTFFSKTFSYFFLPFLDQSTQSNFCHFPSQNLQGFSS